MKQANTSTDQHPLWTLVLAGLDDIKKRESDLQSRLFDLSDVDEADTFQIELQKLSARTERVNRMLDAMGSLLAA
jgi:hypothetical protein